MFERADAFAKAVYRVTRSFPKEERYGITSQLRRSSLSIVLNIVEGFARRGNNEYRRFLYIAFGSLKEAKYLVEFAYELHLLGKDNYDRCHSDADELARMLWCSIQRMHK